MLRSGALTPVAGQEGNGVAPAAAADGGKRPGPAGCSEAPCRVLQTKPPPSPAPCRLRPAAAGSVHASARLGAPAATAAPGRPPPARTARAVPAPGAANGGAGTPGERAGAALSRSVPKSALWRCRAASASTCATPGRPREDRCSRTYRRAMGGAQDIRAPPVHSAAFRARWLPGRKCYHINSY